MPRPRARARAPSPTSTGPRSACPADEVLSWLEGIYLNHHVIPDAEGTLLVAVLERLGGLDQE